MKAKVIISSDSGIESIPGSSIVKVLPDEYHFSNIEVYKSAMEMDFHAFNLRLKLDPQAKVEIKGCSEENIRDILEDLSFEGYDLFYFILSPSKLSYYKPLIEKISREENNYNINYFVSKSEGFPVAYMALQAQRLFDKKRTLEEVEEACYFYDSNNTVYLYAPEDDKLPKVERFQNEDEAFEIKGNNSTLYFLRRNDYSQVRLKEKNKTLSPYIDVLLIEMGDKRTIPFVLYTNKHSLYTKAFIRELEKSFQNLKIPVFEMSPSLVLKYGLNCVAIGYVTKYDKEA